jgi:hypothetical protein
MTESKWTKMFHVKYPTLPFKKNVLAKKLGIPRSILNAQYDKGMKAWTHSGIGNPHQWGTARVYKYILGRKP